MIRYKIYNYQRDVLIQQTRPDSTKYNPVRDNNGDYTISVQEYNDCGLGEPIEFVAPKIEIQ